MARLRKFESASGETLWVAGPTPSEPLVLRDNKDVQPLVEAAREARADLERGSWGQAFVKLERALRPFDSKEDTTQGGNDDVVETELGAVDDGSRLQELLEWLTIEAERYEEGAMFGNAGTCEGKDYGQYAAALRTVAAHVLQLQANEEKGGEG